MTILGMHSFDYGGGTTDYGAIHWEGDPTVSSDTVSRTGSRSLRLKSLLGFGLPGRLAWSVGSVTTVWAQLAFYCSYNMSAPYTDPARFGVFGFWEGYRGVNHINIGWDTSTLQLIAVRNGTEIARSTQSNLYTTNTWIFMEVKVVIHDTTGSVLVKLNGVTHIDATGLDTRNGGSGVVTHIVVCSGCNGSSEIAYVDDFIYGDGTGAHSSPPGDSRVEYLVPIANGNRDQFTPSAGSNWSNVDELGPGTDTDYNYSPEVAETDLFSMSNLSTNGTIHATQGVIRSAKDDAGYRLIQPAFFKSIGQGDTQRLYTGAPASVGDSFTYSRHLVEISPDTGSAWTVEEIDAMEFGYMVGGGNQFSLDCWIEEF